ncbi:MAG: hypothetical protein ABJB74_17700 [Gemmatimonas sp.]
MRVAFRVRLLLRLCILTAPVLIAACLGGRGTKKPGPALPPTPAVTPAKTDSTVPVTVPTLPDSTKPVTVPVNRDSLNRITDSIKKVMLADSIKAAAALKAGLKPKKKATKECILDTQDSPETSRMQFQNQAEGSSILLIGGGFVGHCTGEKNTLKADSAEYFQANGFVNLFGNVTYEEKGEFRVTSTHALYFLKEGRLLADGNVNALQLKSGSTFVGPNIEYLRVMPDIREASHLHAPNSPKVTINQKDSTGKALEPVTISAATLDDNGDSTLVASGNVLILRTDITGKSDSANYNKPTGQARLIRQANIVSTSKDQSFSLAGDTIDLFTHDQILDRVLAMHFGKAKSGEVNMSAERLDLRLVDRKIARAYVYGPGRVTADTKGHNLEADSMDILLPNQRIRELRAFGMAKAVSKPDSMKMKSEENDVLKGDTVFAEFDSLKTAADTNAKPEIKRVVAIGNASSFVQIASRHGREFPPDFNYIRGKHLVVQFDSGQVRRIQVDSSASGGYYEAMIDTLLGDSTKKKPRKPPGIATIEATPSESSRPRPVPVPPAIRASAPMLPSRTLRTR